MTEDVEVVAARQDQSKRSKAATLDLLKNKKKAIKKFSLYLTDDDGEQVEVELTFQALGSKEYDKLVAKFPPKPEQRMEGAAFDADKFAPALISACSVEPEMTLEDAQEIWTSDAWSRGDLMALFRTAVELNNRGIDIPFSEQG